MIARPFLLLLVLSVLPLAGSALQADSLAFEQGRLRIWCETARFVYEDNGADSLLASVNCQSWEALQNSIKSTDASLGVGRLISTVDKPAIYQGYSTNEARLQKLVSEITGRLKQSPLRRSNAQRLNRVDSLGQQLLLIARRLEEDQEFGDPMAGPEPTGNTVNESAVNQDASQTANITSPMPWNEILQWLGLLLLAGYFFWRLHDQESRYTRLKKEYRTLEKQVNEFMINTLAPSQKTATPLFAATPEEPGKTLKETPRNAPAQAKPAASGKTPTPAESRSISAAASTAAASTAAASTAAASTGKISSSDLEQAQSFLPAGEPRREDAPPQVPIPASVQLPQVPEEKTNDGLFFDKMPFRGGFHQNEMSRERQRDSLYTIRVMPGNTAEAEYWITEDTEVQRYAMQNGLSFFEEGCEFTEVEENPGRVVNEQKGRLRREGAVWKILQKARVRFE